MLQHRKISDEKLLIQPRATSVHIHAPLKRGESWVSESDGLRSKLSSAPIIIKVTLHCDPTSKAQHYLVPNKNVPEATSS